MEENSEEDVSSNDASSESSEDEDSLNQRMSELEASLSENPYHYDSHVELVRLCRVSGDLEKTRAARVKMSELFPISEELWLEWVEDELPLVSTSIPEALQDLRELFERAVEDYLSVHLWMLFAKFALEKFSAFPEGMEFPRDIFEKAIIACGLHVSSGGLLWNAYREYEVAILSSLQELQQNEPTDEALKSQVEIQFQRVDKLYKRQLGVALVGMEETFHAYQTFSESIVTEESMPTYVRAKKKLSIYFDFETDLTSSPSLETYRSYISRAKSNKEDGTFVNTLYQRAVAHHCLNAELWKEYITFLTETFRQVKSVLLHGLKQSVRNCPWVVEFWIGYVRAQERLGAEQEEIVETFEKALVGNLSSAKDYLQLWTAYCDYFRRRVTVETPQEAELAELRKTFKRARDYMEAYYELSGDPSESLARYQARLEAHHYGNMEEVRSLWDGIMSRHGKEAQYWLEYAQLERYCGELESCRKLICRAVNAASDSPEQVCEALLQFEREEGTVQSYEEALERCASQMARVLERRERAAEKEAQKKDEKRERKREKRQRPPQSSNQASTRPPQRKKDPYSLTFYEGGDGPRRDQEEKEEDSRPTKKPRGKERDEEDERPMKRARVADEITLPNVQPAATMETSDAAPLSQPPPPPPPPSSVPSQEPSQPSVGEMVEEEEEEGGDEGATKEQRTVFISNLRFLITEEQLRERLVECGKVTDVRLIKTNKSGKGNVYAYVEFASTKGVGKALRLDRSMLAGRPMFVSPFKEKRSGDYENTTQKYNDGKATLYVSNLHHQCNEEELQAAFSECGKIKQVRLVRNKAGRPKGFAYIEYDDETSAALAIQKLDKYDLGGKPISVAISRPPSKQRGEGEGRGTEGSMDFYYQRPTQDEGGKRDGEFKIPTGIPSSFQYSDEGVLVRKSKTNISLVPRVIARGHEVAEPEESPAGAGGNLSNNDFRKLLAKK